MIHIYSKTLSPRLEYIVHTLIGALGVEYRLSADLTAFKNVDGVKLNYSSEVIDSNSFKISPVDLLFKNDIRVQKVECFEFFETRNDLFCLPVPRR